MGLISKQLSRINTEVRPAVAVVPVAKVLPINEVEKEIEAVCFPGMHYNDIVSAVGKINSAGIADQDTILEHKHIIDQYISPDSGEIDSARAINGHKKGYPDQFGSRPKKDTPADCFSSEVYNNLPPKLKAILDMIADPRKKDTALQGIITALSGAFSRWRFYHGSDADVKEYSAHILALTVGAAGSGKGLTRYGYILVEMIATRALEMYKESLAKYKIAKSEYDRQKRLSDKEGKSSLELIEPEKPPKYRFAMSASDTTQAALVEILFHNPIGGFAYDSEVDTMVQGNAKKDFGGFSDVIRKVFHHEPLARQRKGDGESYVVSSPRLALQLSGTHDQLKKLIPTEYNGLFSRVWYYIIPPVFQEYKTATQQTDIIGQACMDLQQEIMESANLWSDELHYLQFTESQERDLWDAMQDKKSIEERYGGDISASWLRMALITKRIAVTLAAFDGCTSGYVPDNCWLAAMGILKAMKTHCLQAVNIIREHTQGRKDISHDVYLKMKATGMSDEAISKEIGVGRKTIARRKLEWGNVSNGADTSESQCG
jgi:Protein of unknown function (DUF3987)